MPKLPMVLLHGWGLSSAIFKPWLKILTPYFQTTSLDLPGHGQAPWIHTRDPLTIIFEQIHQHLNPGGILVGWSLGGLIAQAYTLAYPQQVKKLILLTSSPKFSQDHSWPYGLSLSILQRFAAQLKSNYQQTIRDFLSLQLSRLDLEQKKYFLSLYEGNSPHPAALDWGLDFLANADFRENYPLKCPVTIALGTHDTLVSSKLASALLPLAPNIHVKLLPGAGHLPFWTHANDCLALLFDDKLEVKIAS